MGCKQGGEILTLGHNVRVAFFVAGVKTKRRFLNTDTIKDVMDFVCAFDLSIGKSKFNLRQNMPRKLYTNHKETLKDAGLLLNGPLSLTPSAPIFWCPRQFWPSLARMRCQEPPSNFRFLFSIPPGFGKRENLFVEKKL